MTKPSREVFPVLPWVSLVERLIVVGGVLPTCHLLWTMLLSSWLGNESCLPLFHVLVADWIIRPRLLLILTAVFMAGFVWAAFAKEGGGKMLAVLKVLSTLVVVLALCLTAIAFAALLFPIKGMSPAVRQNRSVYAMQDAATVDEIQRRIGEMGFVVVGVDEAAMFGATKDS